MQCGGCNDVASQKRLTLQRPKSAATKDAGGHVDLTLDANWEDVATDIWGTFTTRGGREGKVFDQVEASVSHIIEFPYRPSLAIQAKWRLKNGSRVFNIAGAVNVDEAQHTTRVLATEVV